MLLDHKLFMQGFTVMRELIGSIGLIEIQAGSVNSAKARKARHKAEVFLNMMQYPEEDWKFPRDQARVVESLRPFYEKLKECGAEPSIREFLPALMKCRNGFDHAWTSVRDCAADIAAQGNAFYTAIEKVLDKLQAEGLLG
jgi:hypothetical protein